MTAAVDSVLPLDRSAKLFARKIQRSWQKSVEGILEVGALLIEAKAALEHGEFQRMVKSLCPFSARTARYLMDIASHPVLGKRHHGAVLPNSWRTLAELARFEPKELSHALGNHWVKPDMTREDVGDLHRRVRKALGIRVRRPTAASKPRPFASQLRAAMDAEVLEWLGSLDDATAHLVADRIAAFVESLKQEGVTDGQ